MSENQLPLVKASDLQLNGSSALNVSQLSRLLKKTPDKYIKTRPAKGGGTWKYLTGGYVKKTLNIMFGWDWDFEILEQLIVHGECVVKGRLTVRTNGATIVKSQFGNKDIAYKTEKVYNPDGTPKMITDKYSKEKQETRPTETPLSIGNDLKAAATDALKKCAAELGIGADVYNEEEFKSVQVVDDATFEEVSNTKERERIVEFIKSAESRTDLLSVLDYCEEHGLIEIYDSRLNEIDNGTK